MIPKASDPGMEQVYDVFAASWGANGQRLYELKRMRHMARYWLRRDEVPERYRNFYAGGYRWRAPQ